MSDPGVSRRGGVGGAELQAQGVSLPRPQAVKISTAPYQSTTDKVGGGGKRQHQPVLRDYLLSVICGNQVEGSACPLISFLHTCFLS